MSVVRSVALPSRSLSLAQMGSMRDDPGDPESDPPRSDPGVAAPDGGDRANSSCADDRRFNPGV